jgi:hypothetical protein
MSGSYSFQDNQGIQDIKPWRSFNLQNIKARYHQVFPDAQLDLEPCFQNTPERATTRMTFKIISSR